MVVKAVRKEREVTAGKLPRPGVMQREGDPSWRPPHETCDPNDCRVVAACKVCAWVGIMSATLHRKYSNDAQGRVCPSCREGIVLATKCVVCGRWTRGGRKVNLVTGVKQPVCEVCQRRLQR